MGTRTELALRIVAIHRGTGGTSLVAIDGLGGAGKSYLAGALANELRTHRNVEVAIVHGDDFFLPSERRSFPPAKQKPIGADFDWRRLVEQVVDPLRRGQDARYQVYDWDRDALAAWLTIPAGALVLIEGVYMLRPELRDLYDLRVWVDCPRQIRLARGIARDGEAWRPRWEQDWMPSEDRYVAECQPIAIADVVVSGKESN